MSIGPFEFLIVGAICLVPLIAVVIGAVLVSRGLRSNNASSNSNLIPCPDCGQRLSPLAHACPRCGRPKD